MDSRTLLKAANRTPFTPWGVMEGFNGEFAHIYDLASCKITMVSNGLVDNLGYSYEDFTTYTEVDPLSTDKIV